MIPAISAINSRSTAPLSIRRFSARPIMPPPTPPAAISASTCQRTSGAEWDARVASRLNSWLKKMIYRLLAAAVLVSMLKKKYSTTRLMGPPPMPRKLDIPPSASPMAPQTARF